jgi:hypothetical protein
VPLSLKKVLPSVQITVVWDVTLSATVPEESAAFFFRVENMKKAVGSSTLIPIYQSTRRHIPGTLNLAFVLEVSSCCVCFLKNA